MNNLYFPDDIANPEQIRTTMYGDQLFTQEEVEILHTRTFQRLYGIKQLGWADRIFPDAVHSRFNHSLGVVEQINRIAYWTRKNCLEKQQKHWADAIQSSWRAIRIAALLHDIFHVPFGHTLEDELQLLPLRHDEDENRKFLMLSRVLAEILFWNWRKIYGVNAAVGSMEDRFWSTYSTGDFLPIIKPIFEQLSTLPKLPGWSQTLHEFLCDFAKASEISLYMGTYRVFRSSGVSRVWSIRPPLATELLGCTESSFDPISEFYICDMIGNTISADLLDYARRDVAWSGLQLDYDDRLLQHFTLVSYRGDVKFVDLDESAQSIERAEKHDQLRLAINIVRHRVRYDALSEILNVLKARYILTERVLYHRTKCAASAMLSKILQLVPFDDDMEGFVLECSDDEFLARIEEKVTRFKEDSAEMRGAFNLIKALRARRFYKPVFQIRWMGVPPESTDHPAWFLSRPGLRAKVEKRIEEMLGLSPGEIAIYCPEKAALKQAECLVVYSATGEVSPFVGVPQEGELGSYIKEGEAIANNYSHTWNMFLFVPERFLPVWPVFEAAFADSLKVVMKDEKIGCGQLREPQNDPFHKGYLTSLGIEEGWGEVPEQIGEAITRYGLQPVCQAVGRVESETVDVLQLLSLNEQILVDSPWWKKFSEYLRVECEKRLTQER